MERPPITSTHQTQFHGITLEVMLTELSTYIGWDVMASKVPLRCFIYDASVKSCLAFLRKTPWARQKVEVMYGFNLHKINKAKEQEKKAEMAAIAKLFK